MLRSSNAGNACKAPLVLFLPVICWENRWDSSAFKNFLIALFGDFLEWNEVGLAIRLKQVITLLWWVQITYTIQRDGWFTVCFCINENNWQKMKTPPTTTKTNWQTIKWNAGEVKRQLTIHSNLRRTAVKRRLHEAEAFQSWETEGFSKYLLPRSDF